ncbi:MAG TPA: ATP-binding protein [Gaiellaceae bacterium]|nr:ATP-binding protein [Gaiellaceae bacterium]
MSRVPIRLRLTLVFTAAMAAVLAAMGVFVYSLVASDLSDALDRELRSRAQDLSALVERNGSLERTGSPFVEHGEAFAELVDPEGRVLDSTPTIGSFPLLDESELEHAVRGPTFVNRPSAPGLDEPARLLAVPVDRGVLVVGATRENRSETLASLRDAFLIGGSVALLLSGLGGYLLSGAALRPIEAMRRRAAEISSSSLDERLPVPPANDEVARLGETLNEMLERLEDGLERERRFVTDASHELRTPLAMLRTELELALRRARTPEELEQSIRSAAEETDRLSRLADDLLLLARAEQGRLPLRAEPTDLADVLETVRARFDARAELEGRVLEVDLDDSPVARVDRLRLEQALGNLVDNALRHGEGAITISAAARDSSAELHVLDEGPGFPAGFAEHAFEPFSRAAPTGDGSGLGLAIVETIVRAHDGEVTVSSRPGGGADVSIRLRL